MDLQDVSHDERYATILETYKSRLEAARAREGEVPNDRPARSELEREHMAQYESEVGKPGAKGMRAAVVGESYLPSVSPLLELKKTMISNLALETHHRGFYLILRFFVPPIRVMSIISLVEDEAGNALTFSLYQQECKDLKTAGDILKKGSVILLKEPYFKCVGDGGYGIRVDHPTDIIWLANDDPRIPSAWKMCEKDNMKSVEEWKQEGNIHVNEGRFREAIQSYTAALASSPPADEAETIHNNRALAYLRLKMYDSALQDTIFVDDLQARSEKALYRGALALYSLGRYCEALEALQVLTGKFPTSKAGASELLRVQARISEQDRGAYNFKKMHKASRLRPPNIDCATHIGPVKVKNIPGKDRGLVTSRGVKAGDLLMCEKAFAYAHADQSTDPEDKMATDTGLLVNVNTKRVTIGTHVSQLAGIYQNLANNPSVAPEFLDLYSGSYARTNESSLDGAAIVDSFLIEKIVSLNAFGSPVNSKDINVTSAMLSKNHNELFDASGVWIKAAYINHSCMKNCARTFIGDMMIVRATKDMPANTELGWCYSDPMDQEKMQQLLSESWGFTCNCERCQDYNKIPKELKAERKNLMSRMKNNDPAKIASEMEKTYLSPARDIPRLEVSQIYLTLSYLHKQNSNLIDAGIYAFKALDALGFVITGVNKQTCKSSGKGGLMVKQWGYAAEQLAECWETLWTVWSLISPDLTEKAREYWKLAYIMVRAGDGDSFEQSYRLKISKAPNPTGGFANGTLADKLENLKITR
ncbi:related to TPR domain protein [Rhynchosporium graminicola]|uniref:Related to TPR domain protein n=1 Tax=Rhynchosporium graminicola TaxID=2792576 RepID=A0A1E1LRE0_9HELO|nr:related to TPR domain protein [Rhynchosporium commune]